MKSLRLRLVLGLSLTLCVLWGSVAAWIGVGVWMPRSARTAARLVGTPRRAKAEVTCCS